MHALLVGPTGQGKGIIAMSTITKALGGKYDPIFRTHHDPYQHLFTNYMVTLTKETNRPGGNLNPLLFVQLVSEDRIPDHSVVSIHEAHRWFDSWNTMRLRDESRDRRMDFDNLVDESRKRDWIILFDTQSEAKIDNRVRDEANYKVKCMNLAGNPAKDFPICIYDIEKDPGADHILPTPFWRWVYQPPNKNWYRELFPLYNTREKGGFYKRERTHQT